jgi:hypothetical protein
MDDNFNELAKEDLKDNLGQRAGNEKTKKFLKKLEIQHKLLKKMIEPGLHALDSNPENAQNE